MSAPVSAIRPAILAEVTARPGQTSYEVAGGLGYRGQDRVRVARIITRMWSAGALTTGTTFRPLQGRPARTFYPATTDSTPQPEPRKPAAPRRRSALRRRQLAGPVMPAAELAAAACRHADPALFFSHEGETGPARSRRVAQAREVCFACPIRNACLNGAAARRELWGVWGALDFETERVERSTQTTRPAAVTAGRA